MMRTEADPPMPSTPKSESCVNLRNGAGHGDKLPRKQEAAISALLTAASITSAAAQVGVSEKTLRNWLKRPGFAAAYAAARHEVLDRTVIWMLAATGKAVRTLV